MDQDTPFGKSVWTSHNTHKVGEEGGHNPFEDPDESDGGNPLEDMLKPVENNSDGQLKADINSSGLFPL